MTAIHYYKLDIQKSSRVQMQMRWTENNVCYSIGPFYGKEYRYSIQNILKSIYKCKSRDYVHVFHGQSSLIELTIISMINIITNVKINIIYDIHDLNENVKSVFHYLKYRYLIMYVLEYIVIRLLNTKTITVSEHLAEIYYERYGHGITVVNNVSIPQKSIAITNNKNLDELVFFGTGERFPHSLINYFLTTCRKLHLYGINLSEDVISNKSVIYHGEYKPNDLDFLNGYGFMILYSDNYSENFKGSLPNKFFQAISYNLVLILSKNFTEIIKILDRYGCHYILLNEEKDIIEVLEKPSDCWIDNSEKYSEVIIETAIQSMNNYQKIIEY